LKENAGQLSKPLKKNRATIKNHENASPQLIIFDSFCCAVEILYILEFLVIHKQV
jgi:hypothetical protein